MGARNDAVMHAAVDSIAWDFFAMMENARMHMPADMPMAADAAPEFTAQFTDAANIFDNLHALPDVVSDILASPVVPRADKRAAILRAAASHRDQ